LRRRPLGIFLVSFVFLFVNSVLLYRFFEWSLVV
jgi:hypothetical protein